MLDIVQFFPSIDHALLCRTLFRMLRSDGLPRLTDRILGSGEGVLA